MESTADPGTDGAVEPLRRSAAAGPLAVTSLALGAVAVVLGVTLIWFFLALPMGLAAIGCGWVERRRTLAATGRAAGGVVTAGIVLGAIAVPVSIGGLVVIPHLQGAVSDTIDLTQDDVSKDLTSIERSFNKSVDDLDRTLSDNVDESAQSLASDFEGLEQSSKEELADVEDRLSRIIADLERTTGADLDELESTADAELGQLETAIRNDLAAANQRVDQIESRLAAEQAGLLERVTALERGITSAGGP